MSKEPTKVPIVPETPETPTPNVVDDSFGVKSALLKIANDDIVRLENENKDLKEMVAKMTQIIEDEQKSELISHLIRSSRIPPELLATMDLNELKEAKKYTEYGRATTFVSGAAVAVDKPKKITLTDKFENSMAKLRAGDYR